MTPKGLHNHSPLLLAVMGRRVKCMALLLEAKASVTEHDRWSVLAAPSSRPVLVFSCSRARAPCCARRASHARRPTPHIPTSSPMFNALTPSSHIVRHSAGVPILANVASWQHDAQSRRACALLLEYGAPINERCPDGSTAHAHATRAQNTLTAELLMRRSEAARRLAENELLQAGSQEGGAAVSKCGKQGGGKSKPRAGGKH